MPDRPATQRSELLAAARFNAIKAMLVRGEGCCRINDPAYERMDWEDAMTSLQSLHVQVVHVCRPEQTDERTVTCPECHAVYVLDEDATTDERSYADG